MAPSTKKRKNAKKKIIIEKEPLGIPGPSRTTNVNTTTCATPKAAKPSAAALGGRARSKKTRIVLIEETETSVRATPAIEGSGNSADEQVATSSPETRNERPVAPKPAKPTNTEVAKPSGARKLVEQMPIGPPPVLTDIQTAMASAENIEHVHHTVPRNALSPEDLWNLVYTPHRRFTKAESELTREWMSMIAKVEMREHLNPTGATLSAPIMNSEINGPWMDRFPPEPPQMSPNDRPIRSGYAIASSSRGNVEQLRRFGNQRIDPSIPGAPRIINTHFRGSVYESRLDAAKEPDDAKLRHPNRPDRRVYPRIDGKQDDSDESDGHSHDFITPSLLHSYADKLAHDPSFQIRLPAVRKVVRHPVPDYDRYGRPISQAGLPIGKPKVFPPNGPIRRQRTTNEVYYEGGAQPARANDDGVGQDDGVNPNRRESTQGYPES
ncbi:hypothetical protein EDC01DRAFT_636279 [Geopyxis carbonaria]|nr:hypothetical protein EDC01DRAFT_636279 [Geopyxis carbonaria]